MNDYQMRVRSEQDDLILKLKKLNAFIQSDQFDLLPDINALLLASQQGAMMAYLGILNLRVRKFDLSEKP